jgi:hypothetical protein
MQSFRAFFGLIIKAAFVVKRDAKIVKRDRNLCSFSISYFQIYMLQYIFAINRGFFWIFLLRLGVRAASNSACSGYPELWILRYPAHRYRAVPTRDSNPRLRVRRSATTLHADKSPIHNKNGACNVRQSVGLYFF